MPHRWLPSPTPSSPKQLEIWPHQSLGPRGFAVMIAVTAGLLMAPLFAVLATPAFWMLLPFLLLAVAGLWAALRRSRRDRGIREVLTLAPGEVTLVQTGPAGRKHWSDNPYWVELRHRPEGGPVEHYLTLRGPAGREVEIGAFLSPDERLELHALLARLLPQR